MKIKQQRAAELENRRMLENAQAAKIEGVEDLQKLYTPVNAEDSKELAAISDNRSKLPDIQSSPSSGNFEQKAGKFSFNFCSTSFFQRHYSRKKLIIFFEFLKILNSFNIIEIF